MKIKTEYAKYLICLLPFLEMPRFGGISYINNFFLIWKIISTVIVCLMIFTKGKLNKLDIVLMMYCGTLIFSTVINQGEVMDSISDALAILVPFLLIEFYKKHFSLKKLVMPIIVLISFYGIVTIFQIVKFPFYIFTIQGMRDNFSYMWSDSYGEIFALGSLKRFGFMLIPALVFTLLVEYPKRKTLKAKMCIIGMSALSLFLLIYSWSIASLFTVIEILILYCLVGKKIFSNCIKIINAKAIFFFFLCTNYLLIMTPFIDKFNGILSLFGKSTNLSGRTYVWERAVQYIINKPLLGYGINRQLTASNFWSLVHMHNLLLNSAYEGGMIGLIFMILNLYLLSKSLSNNCEQPEKKILAIALLGVFILAFADTPEYNVIFMMFPFMYSENGTRRKEKIKWKKF